jgi:hypothetical protein
MRKGKAMEEPCKSCPYEMAYKVEFRNLRADLGELKNRVGRLETTLGRGILLLVANLMGVVMVLMRQLLKI